MTKHMETVSFPQQWLDEIRRRKFRDGEYFFKLIVVETNKVGIEFYDPSRVKVACHPRCKTCKSWTSHKPERGFCDKAHETHRPTYTSPITTGPEFGCVHHEEKP